MTEGVIGLGTHLKIGDGATPEVAHRIFYGSCGSL
jgi:hypothetical protein